MIPSRPSGASRAPIVTTLRVRCPQARVREQLTADGIPTVWVAPGSQVEVLRLLKHELPVPYSMLYDLTAIDERERQLGRGPASFTLIYHLLSLGRNEDLRVKVALDGLAPCVPSVTGLWPAANWYEREVWDMFGIRFDGHPDLRRLLMPATWRGHPLRREHHARATEVAPFALSDEQAVIEERAMAVDTADWGLKPGTASDRLMVLNLGPQHPGTHGLLRLVLELDAERLVHIVPDIGYHHRGAEKMGERQSWHTFIPYTDRIDYLAGVLNNLPYVLAVEQLADIRVPDRARLIRVMLCELFRIISHLVWYGTFAQDLGQMSPAFYTFTDRERALDLVEGITGARMHPSWFRIGGVAQDLPRGWRDKVLEFTRWLPPRLADYDDLVLRNGTIRARTMGIGTCSTEEAIEWGVTGPALRATGCDWDWRKKRPYSGYEQLEFDVPLETAGDCYARARVRVEEMRQSLALVEQCVRHMPVGPIRADHPLTTPPPKPRTLRDIESLIHHFQGVSWGPVVPPGEATGTVEGAKGSTSYTLVSDGDTCPYRVRIRTPSFAHVQFVPELARGALVSDLLAILAATDFVLADVDR